MAYRVRTTRDLDEWAAAASAIGHYFGWQPTEEDAARFAKLLPLDRMHAVWDDGAVVAGAGVFPFGLTVPGGELPCAGVTIVGVLPTHRRRGLLRRMMDAQLRDIRARDEPIAALWASEETIYGRFGYGLVSHEEALKTFPRVYDRVARTRPAMIVRTREWWASRRLDDAPERRRGGGPLVRALLEREGRSVGYALYRLVQEGSSPESWTKTVRVLEAFGLDDAATRDVWRFLFEIDWTDRVAAYHLPLDHPLPLLVDRINKLRLTLWDALWIRLVDVPAALAGRTYASRWRWFPIHTSRTTSGRGRSRTAGCGRRAGARTCGFPSRLWERRISEGTCSPSSPRWGWSRSRPAEASDAWTPHSAAPRLRGARRSSDPMSP